MSLNFENWNACIAECMGKVNIPGAAAVVASVEGTLETYAYGYKNLETNEFVTPITLFAIASVSKNFTGATLAMMVQDGHLHFDEPIKKHLPHVQIGPMDLWKKITCADLLTHNTGLSEESMTELFEGGENTLIEALKKAVPFAPYKTQYKYFNPTYYLMPLLIQKFYGMDWRVFMKERLFDPLGFKHTTACHDEMLTRDHAEPYMKNESGKLESVSSFRPSDLYNMAAGIYSSAAGLGKWIQFHLKKGAPLIEEKYFNQIYHPYTRIDPAPIYTVARYAKERYNMNHYGLGIMIGSVNESPVYLHEGAVKGARSTFVVMPKQNIGAAIVTNMSGQDANSAAMFYLMDEVLGLPFKDHKDYLCSTTGEFMTTHG